MHNETTNGIMTAFAEYDGDIITREDLRLRANGNQWDFGPTVEGLIACRWLAKIGESRLALTPWGRERAMPPRT